MATPSTRASLTGWTSWARHPPSDLHKCKMDAKTFLRDIRAVEDVHEVLGLGSFSTVYACTVPHLGGRVAVKVSVSEAKALSREPDVMKNLQHPNLIQLLAVLHSLPICLAYPVYEGGTLAGLFRASHSEMMPGWQKRLKPASEVASAVAYLHERNIIHRDIKAANIFLTEVARAGDDGLLIMPPAVLGDMGFARVCEEGGELMSRCGSPYFVAPEAVEQRVKYNTKVDVYSLAVLVYSLATLSIFKYSSSDVTATAVKHMLKVSHGWRPCLEKMPGGQEGEALREAVRLGWSHDPNERISSSELVAMLNALVV